MKRILTLSLAFFILFAASAKTNVSVLPPKSGKLNANQVLIPIGKNGETIPLAELARIKVKDLEAITGYKNETGR